MKNKTRKKKPRAVYHEPPMKYNVALHKFEPDLPAIKKLNEENKADTFKLRLAIIAIAVGLAAVLYLMSQAG
ncbi:hypothetical protein KY347_04190 [Candidatus Woesearchaeota archaeon]|nr:hypothetical protein [Candidatus Woesearchaeota archaeon]